MRPDLLRRLCCPRCKGLLRSAAFVESAAENVRDGILLCEHCRLWYPVVSHVPILLLFHVGLHDQFERHYRDRLVSWRTFRSPNDEPLPGEKTVQESFTEEWDLIEVEDDELSFTYTGEDLIRLNRDVWLKWLKDGPATLSDLLVVGCGAGKEVTALSALLPGAKLFATDINLSVIRVGNKLADLAMIHIAICSLFHLPFNEGSFDLVYSQGVIHHNVSTRQAFGAIASYVRPKGHLFVWVYGLDDHLVRKGFAGLVSRLGYRLEAILRPLLSRAPKCIREAFFLAAGVVLHPLVLTRVRHREKWRMKNTVHGLRDWLSPRYAHVHGYNEVIEWFEREKFTIIDVQSPAAYRDLFEKQLWGVGMTGRRLEHAPDSGESAPRAGV